MTQLAPERPRLSGPAVPNVTRRAPAIEKPRSCPNCGVADQVEAIEGEYDHLGRLKLEHLVTIELRYLVGVQSEAEAQRKIAVTERRRGWKYKFFQGRHAMERFICRPCLRESDLMRRDWERKAGKRNSSLEEFYGVLCGND